MVGFCHKCGALIKPGCEFCVNCGYRFDGSDYTPLVRDAPAKLVDTENKDAPYLPYPPRESQLDIIADIRNALTAHRHIILESGTGTGKTIVSLAGALEFIKRPENANMKVIYITRTNSQSDQVMKELKAISTLHPVSGLTLSGRNKSCPLLQSRPDFNDLSPNALSMICTDHKQKTQKGQPGGCSYYSRALGGSEGVARWAKENFPTSEMFDSYCANINICPYETRKLIMKDFDVIVAPYIHIIDPGIRRSLFANLGLEEKDIVLVVDEAHNLSEHAREMESFSISRKLINNALDECQVFKAADLGHGINMPLFIRKVRDVTDMLANRYIGIDDKNKEHLLGPREFEDEICNALGIMSGQLDDVQDKLFDLASDRMEAIADSDDPTSPLMDFATNLGKWIRSPADRYVKAIKADEDGPVLHASCIDPTEIPSFLRRLNGSVHMSGTLQPLSQYAKVLGLPPDTVPRRYPSPFPKENRRTIYATDVTTNYNEMNRDKGMQGRIESYIIDLCNKVHRNTMVFFTSYNLMKKFRSKLVVGIKKPVYWEEPGRQRQTMQLVSMFKKEKDAVFCCVMGGSIAEGIDFPGDELSFAIIVGIPYPPPTLETKAMSDLFDKRYGSGKGWEYVSMVPAVRKIRQAAGRLIRKETDRGMTVILDNRAARNRKDLEAEPSTDVVRDAVEFYSVNP